MNFEICRLHDVWASLALLCDWLISDFKKFPMRIYNQNHHNLEEVCICADDFVCF